MKVNECLDFKNDNSHRLSKDEEARSCVFVEDASLSINDGLVDVEQAQGPKLNGKISKHLSCLLQLMSVCRRMETFRMGSGATVVALWTYSGWKHSDAASRFVPRGVVTGTVSVAPLALQTRGVCSHHAEEVSRGFHDSRWRQAWKRPRPSGGCDRAAIWRSICGDWPVLRGWLAQMTHTQ